MKKRWLSLILVLLSAMPAFADLHDRFPDLVKRDPAPRKSRAKSGVRITYLGTNGYLFESGHTAILVDPYFSRQSLLKWIFRGTAKTDEDVLSKWLKTAPDVNGILVTHGHVDHLFDVPRIMQNQKHAHLYAAQVSISLAQAKGAETDRVHPMVPWQKATIGSATITALPATHDHVFGIMPFNGIPRHIPPKTMDDFIAGETLAYLIEIGGKRIYLAAGSRPDSRPPTTLGRIDLAIQGVACNDSLRALPKVLETLKPKRLLPSHMDDFFEPLSKGFSFLWFTDFPAVRKIAARENTSLMLLDYFQPWTLR